MVAAYTLLEKYARETQIYLLSGSGHLAKEGSSRKLDPMK
jgi:hypothetical protein